MKTRRGFALIVLAAIAGIALVVVYWPRPEPAFEGMSLDAWLDDDLAKHHSDDYRRAISQIGPPAIPFILRRLAQNDSPVAELKYLREEFGPRCRPFLKSISPAQAG